jgi:hypothetical protein
MNIYQQSKEGESLNKYHIKFGIKHCDARHS